MFKRRKDPDASHGERIIKRLRRFNEDNIIDGQGRMEIAKRLRGERRGKNEEFAETWGATASYKKRAIRQDKRNERKEKRRKFFLAFSSNVKWIMLAAAVIAVLLFAKFGLPSMLAGGV